MSGKNLKWAILLLGREDVDTVKAVMCFALAPSVQEAVAGAIAEAARVAPRFIPITHQLDIIPEWLLSDGREDGQGKPVDAVPGAEGDRRDRPNPSPQLTAKEDET